VLGEYMSGNPTYRDLWAPAQAKAQIASHVKAITVQSEGPLYRGFRDLGRY